MKSSKKSKETKELLIDLKLQLEKAVREERYEQAAEFRDKIRELEKEED